MTGYEIVGYVYDGAIYCDCCRPHNFARNRNEVSEALAKDMFAGDSCDNCGKMWTNDWEWVDYEVGGNKYRWARCRNCGSQEPFLKGGYDYREARENALKNALSCRNCLKPIMHF